MQRLSRPTRTLLYDISKDPTEQNDVSAANPAVVAQLDAMLARHAKRNMKPAWPALVHVPIAIDRPLGTPARPGEMYAYWSN
jgi:hypothetical protein